MRRERPVPLTIMLDTEKAKLIFHDENHQVMNNEEIRRIADIRYTRVFI